MAGSTNRKSVVCKQWGSNPRSEIATDLKSVPFDHSGMFASAHRVGIEPTTSWLTVTRSNQLSYRYMDGIGPSAGSRSQNLLLMEQVLYQIELQQWKWKISALDGIEPPTVTGHEPAALPLSYRAISQLWELNSRPSHYKCDALPLS